MVINENLLNELLALAAKTPRMRMHKDLRDSPEELSQRMLNALLPGTPLPIHRHNETSETVIILRGSMDEIFYDSEGLEISRVHLQPSKGLYGVIVPIGQYHGVEIYEPSIIVEYKTGRYDEDKTEDFLHK